MACVPFINLHHVGPGKVKKNKNNTCDLCETFYSVCENTKIETKKRFCTTNLVHKNYNT